MYTIKEVAQRSGFSAYTLRYYERQNILPPVGRDSVGNRLYTDDDMELLSTIRCLKTTGMPISEIGLFISLCRQGDGTLPQRQQIMLAHQAHVQAKIDQMTHELESIQRKVAYYSRACQAGTERFEKQKCGCGYVQTPLCGADCTE